MVNRPGRQERSGGKSGFNYKPPSAESLKKRATQKGGMYDSIYKNGFDTWKAKEGSNQIRVLPPTWDDHDHYAYEIWIHRNIGTDNATYLCLRKNKDPKTGKEMNKPCACCDLARSLKDDGEADDAKKVDVQRAFVCWIVDRDGEEDQAHLWQMGWMMDRDLAALCVNERTGKTLFIAHPDEGYDILLRRVGKDMKTRYTPAIDRESSPIAESSKIQKALSEYCQENPVPSTLKFYPNDYLESVINGNTEEDDEELDEKKSKAKRNRDDDEDETPKSKRRSRDDDEDESEEDEKPTRSRRSRDEEEDEDEDKPRSKRRRDEEDETEEEEDEEKPRSKRRRDEEDEVKDDEEDKPRSRRKSSDDDEEDEDEEKPRKRARASDDEDDEPEEDDDEVEDKPRKTKTVVKRRPIGKRR